MKKILLIVVAFLLCLGVIVLGVTIYLKLSHKNASNNNAVKTGCELAIEKVLAEPAVQQYKKDVPNAKVDCDHEENNGWTVHVYEIVLEKGDIPSHTATFDWFTVSPQGQVLKLVQ